jgi:hypothetical protein
MKFTDEWQPTEDRGFLPRKSVTFYDGVDPDAEIDEATGMTVAITVHVSDRGRCSYSVTAASEPTEAREVRWDGRVSTPSRSLWRIHGVNSARVFLERVEAAI